MKKFIFALAALSTLLASCSNGVSSKPSSLPSSTFEGLITVNFYIDYNAKAAGEVYFATQVKNGDLITEVPNTPTVAPFDDLPKFLGWSYKELINDRKDIWDFANDRVYSESDFYSIYGIWVAEGE